MIDEQPVVWASVGGAAVELRRLRGPSGGQIEAPAHLMNPAEAPGHLLDLDDPTVKIRLYELLLTRGSAFDLYHWVNLDELIRLWENLRLPRDIAAPWAWALQSAQLQSVRLRSVGPRSAGSVLPAEPTQA